MKKKMTVGVIGGGNMGGAIIHGIHHDYVIYLCEADKKKAHVLKRKNHGIKLADLKTTITESQMIILAVKPQDFDVVLSEIKKYITPKHLVISIAAGMTTTYIEKKLDKNIRVIRTMPNLPVQVGMGMTAICEGTFATIKDQKWAEDIFETIGETAIVDEKWMNAVTAVSGSGPAYVFYFIECFMKAAQGLGLDKQLSSILIMQTLEGSLKLLTHQNMDASILRQRVTSKGGTTQAALDELFTGNMDKIFVKALESASRRAQELSK
jgi:pyrroline-5-carboxylate reductase